MAMNAPHYVASDGTDTWANATNSGTPCSLSTAITNAAAGDIVKIKAGTYTRSAADTVAIVGTEDANVVAHLRRLRRVPVVIQAGEPFTLPPIEGQDRDAALQAYTDEIMCRIAALLPPQYRGVYADHPRLKALLENKP